jgi:hypothetical protein
MYEKVITPRANPVCTPEQLAAFGNFDCPVQFDGCSPPNVTADYALIQTFIEAATDQVETLAATATTAQQILLTFDLFPNQMDPRVVCDYLLYSYDWVALWWRGFPTKESIEPVRRPLLVDDSSDSPPIVYDPVVTYNDCNGDLQTLDPATYNVFADKLTLNVGCCWPATDRRQDCVQLAYWCGYGETAASVPARLILAVMFLANHFHDCRNIVSVEKTSDIAMTLKSIVQPFRSYRIPH